MEQEIKQKLNEKIAKWCGFVKHEYTRCSCHPNIIYSYWRSPETVDNNLKLPPFTDSMDACIKWIVPKLKELGWMSRIQTSPLRDNDTGKLISDWTNSAYLYYTKYDKPIFKSGNYWEIEPESMSLAFCLVVEKLIDTEVKP